MTTIDCMGKPCPIPVIETKKAMATLPPSGGQLLVRVDNEIACQNLEKMVAGNGGTCVWEKAGDASFQVTITVGERDASAPVPDAKASAEFVVAIGNNQMGSGSEELGKILLKGFVYALSELDELPGCLLFYNAGAHLTAEGSSSLEDLQSLASKGTIIYTCGTCADYYGIKDRIAVGEIANMYGIVTAMAGAKRLINL